MSSSYNGVIHDVAFSSVISLILFENKRKSLKWAVLKEFQSFLIRALNILAKCARSCQVFLRFYFAIEPGESSSAVSMSPLSQNHIIFDEESHSADS
jgi:hypothetical protein